jgi:hypothetical protein
MSGGSGWRKAKYHGIENGHRNMKLSYVAAAA